MGEIREVKVKTVGETLTMMVAACTKVAVGSYPETRFDGQTEDGEEVYTVIPEKSAERNLTRLKLTRESVVGHCIVVTRAPNAQYPDKPFINLHVGIPWEPSAPPPSQNGAPAKAQQAAQAAPESTGRESLSSLYLSATRFVLEQVVPMYEAKELGVTDTAVAAMVATVYIQACKGR